MGRLQGDWNSALTLVGFPYVCGYCQRAVGGDKGYVIHQHWQAGHIRICPVCNRPSFFEQGKQYPGVPFGEALQNLPQDVEALYDEARRAAGAGAYTAAVLAARKILMHVAVEKKADQNKSFEFYVTYLDTKGYIPPNGKDWVDEIRKRGNDANHEILVMTAQDAEMVLTFVEMLLKIVYEFPAKVPKP